MNGTSTTNNASDRGQADCRPDEPSARLSAGDVPIPAPVSAHEDGSPAPSACLQHAETKLPGIAGVFRRVVFCNYANFKGRATRREFWLFMLFHILVNALLVALMLIPGFLLPGIGLLFFWQLLMIVPLSALFVRRLHDVGRSGWWWGATLICYFAAGNVAGGIIVWAHMQSKFEAQAELQAAEEELQAAEEELAVLNLMIQMRENGLNSVDELCLAWGYDELIDNILFENDEEETLPPSAQEGEQTGRATPSSWQRVCNAASSCIESPVGLALAGFAGLMGLVSYILACICTYFALLAGRAHSSLSHRGSHDEN